MTGNKLKMAKFYTRISDNTHFLINTLTLVYPSGKYILTPFLVLNYAHIIWLYGDSDLGVLVMRSCIHLYVAKKFTQYFYEFCVEVDEGDTDVLQTKT